MPNEPTAISRTLAEPVGVLRKTISQSSEAGVSKFHFCRLFKRATGFAPSRYFIRMRMEKARRLLRETEKSVIEVGLEVGYASPSHFAQIFRREVGVVPTHYRGR